MSRSTAAFPRGLDLRFWGVVNQVNEVNLLPNPFLAKGFCLESFEKKVHIEGGDSLRYLTTVLAARSSGPIMPNLIC